MRIPVTLEAMTNSKKKRGRTIAWSPPAIQSEIGYSWGWSVLVLLLAGTFFWGRWAKKTPVIATPPPEVVRDARWDGMVGTISTMVDRYPGEVGLYIKDLKNGRSFEHNADQRFVCASLIKLPIMAATFEAIRENKLSLSSEVLYRRAYRRGGSGLLQWARPGVRFTLSYLLYMMITKSDNTATAIVINQLGYDYLNNKFAEFGLEKTRIASTGMSLDANVDPALDNYTTAREMGMILEKIYRREMVRSDLSEVMLEILKRANARSRLAKYLPHDWQLARKTGLLRRNCHDVGIVFSPEGDYLICVLTGKNNDYPHAKGLIAQVGRTAYAYMSHS